MAKKSKAVVAMNRARRKQGPTKRKDYHYGRPITAAAKAKARRKGKTGKNKGRKKLMGASKAGYDATSSHHRPAFTKSGAGRENKKIISILNKRKKLPISDPLRSPHDKRNVRLIARMSANIKHHY